MIPGKYNITIYRGSTFNIHINAVDGLGDIYFNDEYTSARLHIRPAWVNTPSEVVGKPLLEMTTENFKILIVGKQITLTLSAKETAALNFFSGVYDLELVNTSVNPIIVDKILYGTVTVKGEVTV
jgi:hypothetical protein